MIKSNFLFQASFLTKKININGNSISLSIWDTAGQERYVLVTVFIILSVIMIWLCLIDFRFHALGPIYYRSSNGAILVYDITDHDSFQKVCISFISMSQWIVIVEQAITEKYIPLFSFSIRYPSCL